jgi:transketolase
MNRDGISMQDAQFDHEAFDRMAAEWRYIITDMICRAKSGHLGGCLSLVEIVMTLYWRILNVDPADPKWPDRDRLIVSKGHAAALIYVALAYKGFIPAAWLKDLKADGSPMDTHCHAGKTPGVEMTTGALGQGLSCAIGFALAARFDQKKHRVFCIIGDGESQEGQVWEAAMFAAHHKLDNLVAITDYNKLQIDGFIRDVVDLEPLVDKWRAFGWETFEMDGHDWDSIHANLTKAIETRGKPAMIIAHTTKGKGLCGLEGTRQCHNVRVPDRATRDKYMDSLYQKNFTLPY